MPDIRIGVDPSGARRGIDEVSRGLQGLIQEVQKLTQTLQGAFAGVATPETTRAFKEQAAAIKESTRATEENAAAKQRFLRSRREEEGVVAKIVSGLQSEEAAVRKAAQAQATYLSTLGGAARAASQYAVALSRIETSLKAGIVTERQANYERELAAKTFTTANINAKDLRLNMQGLHQSMHLLTSVLTRINPLFGAIVGSMSRAGEAIGKLSGGFALLGPMVGILAAVASGFGAVAVAGDRLGRIPTAVKGIWEGFKELAAQAADATGATEALVTVLEKIRDIFPARQTPVQAFQSRVEQLQAELKALPAAAPPSQGRGAREFGIGNQNEVKRAQLTRDLAAAESDLAAALGTVNQKLNLLELSYTEEGRAAQEKLERDRKILALAQEGADQTAVRAQLTQSNAQYEKDLADIEKRRADNLAKLTPQQREYNKALEERKRLETQSYEAIISALKIEDQRSESLRKTLEDLRFENQLSRDRLEALNQGTDAIRAQAIAEAELRKARELRVAGLGTEGADQAAIIREAGIAAGLQHQISSQKKATEVTVKLWDDAVSHIQETWSDLWANILSDGDKTFKDLTSNFKGLFTTLAGTLISGAFKPIFDAIKSGTGGQAAGSAGGFPGGGQGPTTLFGYFGAFRDAIEGGVTDSFRKLGLSVGGALGSSNAVGIGNAFGVIGAAGVGFGISQSLVGNLISKRREQEHQLGILVGAGTGAVAGAIIGSFVPVIGTAIGAIVGGIVGGLVGAFVGGEKGTALQVRTLPTDAFIRPDQTVPRALRPRNTYIVAQPEPTPFGFVGAIGAGTGGGINMGDLQRLVRSIARFDAQINQHLTTAQTEIVKASAFIGDDMKFSNTRDSLKIFRKRATDVLLSLQIPLATAEDALGAVEDKEGAAGIAEAFGKLITARRSTLELIDELRGLTPPANDAIKALDQLNQDINQLRLTAPDLGIVIENFDQLRQQALARFTSDFNKDIADSILEIENPFELVFREWQESSEKLVREAQTAGADLVQVERLNALQRQKLLEEFNAPIIDTIKQIRFSPVGSSPIAALGAAEQNFFALAGKPGASRQDIASAAQTFLSLGEQFLGGPTFAAKRDVILETLESLLLTLPGTAADTGEQLQDLNLETARGNAVTEQLLSQMVTENAAMRNEMVNLRSDITRLLAA